VVRVRGDGIQARADEAGTSEGPVRRVRSRWFGTSRVAASPAACQVGGTAERVWEDIVEIGGIISAIVVGAIIGALGRLVVPGRQRVGILLTVLVGIVAALVGTWLAASLLGTGNWLITLLIQVALAALGVAAIGGRRSSRRVRL
jgi:uncharacterized membrane protein YeaQ/YmgE (transglycosylase-associated protein family)